MKETVTLGIIGCGRIASIAHFPALSGEKNVRIKYACDLIPEKAENMKIKYGCDFAVTDYKEILADKEVDAVFVLTPNASHFDISMDAISAGKHVFCEKPITISYPLSEKMARAAKEKNRILNIGVCNRFNTSVEMLEKLNREGKFGEIYHVFCSFRNYRSIPGLGGAFTTKAESGGGVLIDWGVHFFDLILYILGGAKLKTVTCDTYCKMAANMRDYKYVNMWAEDTKDYNGTNDVDDMVSGYIRTDRANINFIGAWAQNIGENEMFIDFLGDKGGARLNYGKQFTWWTVEEGTLIKKEPIYTVNNHYAAEDKAFIQSVLTGDKTKSYIDNILESAKLLDALYDSASTKKEILF